jgi:hypothetical protein
MRLNPFVVTLMNRRISFVGQLDELSIYNRALSEREVKRHFKAMNSNSNVSRFERSNEA